MKTVNFILRYNPEPDAKKIDKEKLKKPQKIHIVGRFGRNDKLVYPTKFSVIPKFWDKDAQRVGNYSAVIDKTEINNHLNEVFTKTEKYISKLKEERKPVTKEAIKKFLDEYYKPETATQTGFFGFVDKFIKQSETRLNPSSGQKISPKTITRYRIAERVLKDFAAQYYRVIDFDNIDMDFYNDFVKFMQTYELRTFKKKDKTKDEKGKPVKGFATNTMGKQLSILKVFLNDAYNRGLTKNNFHKTRNFKVVSEESDSVYLNEDELQKIYDLDLSQSERLEKVRDLFIIGSWTGLRFSDLVKVSPDKINGDLIYIEQQKTGGKVVIPIHPTCKSIIQKYNGELPRKISNQKMNDYIKEVCQIAKINEEIHKGITRGGLKVSKKYEKWELVSTHTARRSFATNLYKQGFPSISIMKITGHKTEKAFLKYIKVTPEENAKMLQMHWQSTNKLRVV